MKHKTVKEINPEVNQSKELVPIPENGVVPFESLALSVFTERQFQILTQKTPAHAIKYREGSGGQQYPYLKSGYVEMRLTQAFGGDWQWTILPIADGRLYMEREAENKKGKKEIHLGVMGALTVRIRNPKDVREVIAEVTKHGIGSQIWRDNTEFFDSLKGAESDALKRAARKFGVGADLAWNDEQEQVSYEKAQEILNGIKSEPITEPKSIAEFLGWVGNQGIEYPELLRILNVQVVTDISDFAEAMAKVKAARGISDK